MLEPKGPLMLIRSSQFFVFLFYFLQIFPMLCWFLLHNNANQPQLYIYLCLLESPSPPTIPSFQIIIEHQTGLLVLYSSFLLVIYFTHDSVCVCAYQCYFLSFSQPLSLPCYIHNPSVVEGQSCQSRCQNSILFRTE